MFTNSCAFEPIFVKVYEAVRKREEKTKRFGL